MMPPIRKTGRSREVTEIVRLKRAAVVGRLLLGELDGPMESVFPDDFEALPRSEIKKQREQLRGRLKGQIAKFCAENFNGLAPEDLSRLYVPLFEHGSSYRIPLTEFTKEYGKPRSTAIRGAPQHATIVISPWGLQTEFPELHLIKDLVQAYNTAITIGRQIEDLGSVPWSRAKASAFREDLANQLRGLQFHKRMTLVACFNLVEAYVNGLAWEYVLAHDVSTMSKRRRNLLTEVDHPVNIVDKLIKIPHVVAGREVDGPLHQTREPLKTFIETVKPFRDAVVHASPFAAPERFGGYDKLARLYDLDMETVTLAVGKTLEIIAAIHAHFRRKGSAPEWIPRRKEDGSFEVQDVNK